MLNTAMRLFLHYGFIPLDDVSSQVDFNRSTPLTINRQCGLCISHLEDYTDFSLL
ncbi:hypothetical protein LPA06_02210 [Lacticaseibacillus paracasei subsp. tolerans]|nr:hypothetical protein LPA06_02210 [Lacticaseibacillus paracasei subsp. tolerans]